MFVPRPQSSVVVLDPARFAASLQELRRTGGFPQAGLRGAPLGIRAFARELGISAPALLAQLAGERRFLRVRTLRGIWRMQERLLGWVRSEPTRLQVEALLMERHSSQDCFAILGGRDRFHTDFQRAIDCWSMEDEIIESMERLERCAIESWVFPGDSSWPAIWGARPTTPPRAQRHFRSTQLMNEWARLVREWVAAAGIRRRGAPA